MSRSRARLALFVAVVAALASGCALVVSGLDTDFSSGDGGAVSLRDGSGGDSAGDATTRPPDAATDASAPPLAPPTPFSSLALACTQTSGWQLDCTFGTGGSVVVGWDSVVPAPVLTEGDGGQAVYVAVGRDGGTVIEGIDVDGGRTSVAIADAGDPVDLTLASVATPPTYETYEAIAMLSNLVADGASSPVLSVKGFQGPALDSTNDIVIAQVSTPDASVAAVGFVDNNHFSFSPVLALTTSFVVNISTGPGEVSPGTASAYVATNEDNGGAIEPLIVSGAPGGEVGPISAGMLLGDSNLWVVGAAVDGGGFTYLTEAGPPVFATLPSVVDDGRAIAREFPFAASRSDGGARIDYLLLPAAAGPLATFPLDDSGDTGPLHLREVDQPDAEDLLVAAASSTGNLYLALYSFVYTPLSLTLDPMFGDAGILVVPLGLPAQLGRAVFSKGAFYVSLTLTTDAGAQAAVVIRIVNRGSP